MIPGPWVGRRVMPKAAQPPKNKPPASKRGHRNMRAIGETTGGGAGDPDCPLRPRLVTPRPATTPAPAPSVHTDNRV